MLTVEERVAAASAQIRGSLCEQVLRIYAAI